ncbi:MAG: hypothetical protein ACR2N5_06420 [Solirubrobacterales bacterium]
MFNSNAQSSRSRTVVAGAAALVLAALVLGWSASRSHGAVELGQVASVAGTNEACQIGFNLVQDSTTGPAYTVPTGGGVITSWSHEGIGVFTRGVGGEPPGSGRLLVWELIAGAEHRLVGGSAVQQFSVGLNTFDVRVPVDGGELLGLRTSAGAVGCVHTSHLPGDAASGEGEGATDPQPGDVRFLDDVTQAMTRVNVAATLEPDADGDGYGDESQDVEIELRLKNRLKAKKKGFPVKVSCGGTDCEAKLKGTAIAKTKGGSSATAAKKTKFKVKTTKVSIDSGATKKTKLKMKKHKKSQRKLTKLLKGSSKGSKLKLTATAENSIGSSDKAKDKAKLKG